MKTRIYSILKLSTIYTRLHPTLILQTGGTTPYPIAAQFSMQQQDRIEMFLQTCDGIVFHRIPHGFQQHSHTRSQLPTTTKVGQSLKAWERNTPRYCIWCKSHKIRRPLFFIVTENNVTQIILELTLIVVRFELTWITVLFSSKIMWVSKFSQMLQQYLFKHRKKVFTLGDRPLRLRSDFDTY